MQMINPYLNFDGNTEEAFEHYRSVLGGELDVVRFRDLESDEMDVPADEQDKIAHAGLLFDDEQLLMGTDVLDSGERELTAGNNFYITVELESAEESERAFDELADGGEVQMPLTETEWAEAYGVLVDRFGIQWMVSYTGDKLFE